MSSRHGSYKCLFLLATLVASSQAMERYIGDRTDGITQNVSQSCGGYDQTNFETGRCPILMRCVLDALPSDTAAGFESGGSIAGLVPTILALIAAPPMELVQLAFLSPHRALWTACFGIGLPAGLFRQLRATYTSLTDVMPNAPKTREWSFRLPPMRAATRRRGWEAAGLTLLVDACVGGLTAVALWFNYKVSSSVMITWRCEYGWLVFMWPMACILWLLLSLSTLWAMSESITVELRAYDEVKKLGILQLTTLPYRSSSHITERYMGLGGTNSGAIPRSESSPAAAAASAPPCNRASTTTAVDSQPTSSQPVIVLSISMPHEIGIRSWRWFEATIETLAVGVYLYATLCSPARRFSAVIRV